MCLAMHNTFVNTYAYIAVHNTKTIGHSLMLYTRATPITLKHDLNSRAHPARRRLLLGYPPLL